MKPTTITLTSTQLATLLELVQDSLEEAVELQSEAHFTANESYLTELGELARTLQDA